jgi:hypothetical protein
MTATEDAQQKRNSVYIRRACGSSQARAERPLSAAVRVDSAPQTPDTVAASAATRPDAEWELAASQKNPLSSGRTRHRKITSSKFGPRHGLAVFIRTAWCSIFFSDSDSPLIAWNRHLSRNFRGTSMSRGSDFYWFRIADASSCTERQRAS